MTYEQSQDTSPSPAMSSLSVGDRILEAAVTGIIYTLIFAWFAVVGLFFLFIAMGVATT